MKTIEAFMQMVYNRMCQTWIPLTISKNHKGEF